MGFGLWGSRRVRKEVLSGLNKGSMRGAAYCPTVHSGSLTMETWEKNIFFRYMMSIIIFIELQRVFQLFLGP